MPGPGFLMSPTLPRGNISLPKRKYPVVDFDGGWYGDDQCGCCKEKSKVWIHAADVHVMGPNKETQCANADNSPNHHPVAKYVFTSMYANQVRNDAECRQRHDIDLRVTEEPE